MKKSTLLAVAIVAMALSFCFVSCGSKASGQRLTKVNSTDVKARGHKIWQSTYDFKWRAYVTTQFLTVNELAQKGDTLSIDGDTYVLDSVIANPKPVKP